MKAILEFDLPEDRTEFNLQSHGTDWALVVWDLDQELRKYLKYGHEFKTAAEALERTRAMLREFVDEHGVNLGDIT